MDLLGSILNSMDAPPSTSTRTDPETQKRITEAKKKAAKFKDVEKRRKLKFRSEIEGRITKFVQSGEDTKTLVFEPMDHIFRSIAHDVTDVAGLPAYSFGEEGADRHLVVWQKEHAPSEAELQTLRNGDEWNEELAARLAADELKRESDSDKEERPIKRKRTNKPTEPDGYFEKYAKIVGEDSGVEAAHITKSNSSYGMVPSKNKQDQRTIEQTMKDMRDRKLQRQMESENGLPNTYEDTGGL